MTSTPAGVWVRVSTADQTEASQVPDVERRCQDKGYRIERRYELNDLSASKGEQQAKLDEMLADMREGHIKVIVCWHSDRMERRGPEALFKLLRQIKDAGGTIESVKEPLLGTEDLSGEAVTAINAVIAHQESVQKAERQKISVAGMKARGAVYNNLPWGYVAVGEKLHKRAVPTDLCRSVVPEIFARCIAGDSLRTIAAWLDSQGIPTPRGKARWNESSVRWTIRTRAYAGRLQTRDGQTIATCEAVISAATFDRANQSLATRPKRGPANIDRPLLANLRCARCGASMYRIRSGSTTKRYYYRCFGNGPQRKGCGNMLRYDFTEILVVTAMTAVSAQPHRTREWAEGVNWDSEISDVKQDIREAADAERFDKLPELQEKLAELRSREVTKGRWEYQDSGITEGQYFNSLKDYDAQREYLKTHDIRAEKAPERDGMPGARLVVDGNDLGIIHLDLSRIVSHGTMRVVTS